MLRSRSFANFSGIPNSFIFPTYEIFPTMNPAHETESRTESVPVTVRSGPDRPESSGKVDIITWSTKERSRRALKALGISWGIGLFCVIMPVVHFFAVPGMFVAGIILFTRLSAQATLVIGGAGTCPECGNTFTIAKANNRFPMDEVCEHCKANVSISLTNPPSEPTA